MKSNNLLLGNFLFSGRRAALTAKEIGISFLLLLFTLNLCGQKTASNYSLYKNIPIEARLLTTDKLQQFYLVNVQNDLIKFNPAGTEVFRYSNNKLGNLETVDVSNPFHILLHYPEFGRVITLDRTLSITGSYNLFDLGVIQAKALGVSFDNNIWVYDELDFRLRKYDNQGEIVVESPDLSMILPGSISPISILEHNNIVYLHDPASGILLFDIFGQFIKTFPLQDLRTFQIRDRHLFGLQNNDFFIWQLDTGIRHPVQVPVKVEEDTQLRLEQNYFFVLQEGAMKIFRKNELPSDYKK